LFAVVALSFLLAQPKVEPQPTEQPEVKYFFSGDSGKVTPAFHIPTKKWTIYFTVQATDNSFFKFVVYREGSGVPLTETMTYTVQPSARSLLMGGREISTWL